MKAWGEKLDRWDDEHPALSTCLGALLVVIGGAAWTLLLCAW